MQNGKDGKGSRVSARQRMGYTGHRTAKSGLDSPSGAPSIELILVRHEPAVHTVSVSCVGGVANLRVHSRHLFLLVRFFTASSRPGGGADVSMPLEAYIPFACSILFEMSQIVGVGNVRNVSDNTCYVRAQACWRQHAHTCCSLVWCPPQGTDHWHTKYTDRQRVLLTATGVLHCLHTFGQVDSSPLSHFSSAPDKQCRCGEVHGATHLR